MFEMTESAGVRLLQKLAKKVGRGDRVMRFVRKPRGWQLRLDKAANDDNVFECEGRAVLVVDANAVELLADRTLDTKKSSSGNRLCLR